jgi:acylglycerol lipase
MKDGAAVLEDYISARDGRRLFQRRWQPAAEIRARVLLVHGFIEHSGRYGPTGQFLARHGCAVTATDLRGHGRSDGARCWVRSFDEYIDDLDSCFERANRRADGIPLFVLGHSLGGLIAVLWCIRRRPWTHGARKLDGLILSGPALQVSRRLFPWLQPLAGVASALVPRLRLLRMGGRNLSRDPQIVEQFLHDPLVYHGRFPVRSGAEILRAGSLARAQFEALEAPLLILQGSADRVVAADAAQELFQRARSTDKTLKLYPGLYHEVLNEPEKDQVLSDLREWIERRARGDSSSLTP